MTTPDLFSTVGFEKSKIGANETELGYAIKRTRLIGVTIGTLGCLGVLAFLVVWTQFEVHLEKRAFHRQLRKEEHHAASKLAQVSMELWAEYRDDIHESSEAHSLLKSLEESHKQFQGKLSAAIDSEAKELGLNKDKAAHLADKILHLVADMQQQNLQHTKRLVDHLVNAGKKALPMEKHMEKEILQDLRHEEKHIAEDAMEGEHLAFEGGGGGGGAGALEQNGTADDEDPLKGILEGFWFIFNDYEGEFAGKPRETLVEGNKIFDELKVLNDKIHSSEPIDEDEIVKELDAIDLGSVGAGLGSGRVLPAPDIVEELVLINKIPHEELQALEKAWRDGKEDSVTVFGKLSEWHEKGIVPSGWLEKGVDRYEDEEVKEELLEESEELKEIKEVK